MRQKIIDIANGVDQTLAKVYRGLPSIKFFNGKADVQASCCGRFSFSFCSVSDN
jgi:hypothetical protein